MSSDTLDCRVLLGWMPRQQAVSYLLNECQAGRDMSIGIAEDLWRQYRARVDELPAHADTPARTFPLDEADRETERRFRRLHPEAADVSGFIRIQPMDLQIHQLQVVTDPLLGYSKKIQREGWLKTAMPEGDESHPIRWRVEQSRLVFELPHGEFVLTAPAPPDARMQIAPLPSWVSVARFEGRTLLVNGYHRTFAWLNRPQHVQVNEHVELHDSGRENSLLFPLSCVLPFPDPPDQQTKDVLLGSRPPRFADFFDSRLALPVKLHKNKHYEMRVQVEIVGIRDEEPEQIVKIRSARV